MSVQPGPVLTEPLRARHTRWYHKLGALVFIFLCFEIGTFLLIFPWLLSWSQNAIPSASPWLRDLWNNGWFRGALSGLGLANLWISFAEIGRLRRFKGSHPASSSSV